MTDKVTILLDGETREAKAETTILMAAAACGIAIPHLCYHPGLSVRSSCGLCVVEVGPSERPRLVKACETAVAAGMVIRTRTEQVLRLRRFALDFLLASHQLDCPVCDKAGECELQEYVHQYAPPLRALAAENHTQPGTLSPLGAHVGLQQARCIGCGRCVRFCDEISQTHELQLFGRGMEVVAGTGGATVDNPLSGNLPDLCPAGALVDLEFRCTVPAWRLRGIDSICPGCASGCNVRVDVDGERIVRLRPRMNAAVNRYWLCDRGRFGWKGVHAPRRLGTPTLGQEAPESVSWSQAVSAIAAAMGRRFGPGSVGVVSSGRQTNEEVYLLARLATEVWNTRHIALWPAGDTEPDRCFGDGYTVRGDLRPNARGAAEVLRAMGIEPLTATALWRSMRDGPVRAAFILSGGAPIVLTAEEEEALAGLEFVVVVDTLPSPLTERAQVVLPGYSPWEKDGTFTNADGRIQRLHAVVPAPAGAVNDWEILQRLACAHGASWQYAHPRQLAAQVSALLGAGHAQLWVNERSARDASGQPFGGGWADWQRRHGLLRVADHTKGALHGSR